MCADAGKNGVLRGKVIIFLGSSVTYGAAAGGRSFVEALAEKDGILPVKEAVSGTTLVEDPVLEKESYIARMRRLDPALKADAFVCQLSTNDASRGKPLGEVAEGFAPEGFDTATVAGAIEYIIAYAKKTWQCPVVFYTGTKFASERYAGMVELLLRIREKWGIGLIDLWNDAEMNGVSEADYRRYMADGVHPTAEGYREWWTPKFEAYLEAYLVEPGR